MDKLKIICPCCDATLTIDAQTGALLSHEEKKKAHGSFEDLAGELTKQKELREQLFAQEMSSMKDRERLLEEKFQEALKRADSDGDKDKPFRNPLDLD
ncbi:MAG: 2-nitropropane dioxygenase [Acidobacteriota bacterium]